MTKIPGGLRYRGKDRFFTYSILAQGYETFGQDVANIELDNTLVVLFIKDSTVDGQTFTTIQEQIDYIYQPISSPV